MTNTRYNRLMNQDAELTRHELGLGWHFCVEWDGLLVGPHMGELACCRCLPEGHPVYKTVPVEEPAVIDPGII